MNILVIGNGAREHSLCYAINKSPYLSKLFSIPGNYGIGQIADCHNIDINDFKKIHQFVIKNDIKLIVVGPEGPLVNGIVDFFFDKNIKIFGPQKSAAQLEGSKSFVKDLCKEYNIPTADYKKFENLEDAKVYLKNQKYPLVVKADGLAAGKGVTIVEKYEDAIRDVEDIFNNKFETKMNVVVEEFMEGDEASYFICSDGNDFISLLSAQDHKRIGEHDTGPNTGGMGAYSPAPIFNEIVKKQVDEEIIKPTLIAMKKRGIPFKGILYAGLMIKDQKARLVEYNIRFGDPECQVLMLNMKSDIIELMLSSIDENIKDHKTSWHEASSATVVMSTKGYPGSYEKGSIIKNLSSIENNDDFQIFHAATIYMNGEIKSNGGRVLSITAKDKSLELALNKIYNEIENIDWPEGYYRKDIGFKAFK